MDNAERKLFVLDTNILLHEPLAIFSFQEHDVVIPMTVLEELDRIKDSKRDVSRDARVAIRALENIFHDATPEQISAGICFNDHIPHNGTIAIFADYEVKQTVHAFSDKAGDNRILNSVLFLQQKHAPRSVVLVTKDINMRLRAKGAGVLNVDDYRSDQLIDDVALLSKGFHRYNGNFWSNVAECHSENRGSSTLHTLPKSLFETPYVNQYLLDDGEEFAARIKAIDGEEITIKDISYERLMHRQAWGFILKIFIKGWRWMQCLILTLIW